MTLLINSRERKPQIYSYKRKIVFCERRKIFARISTELENQISSDIFNNHIFSIGTILLKAQHTS